MADYSLLDSSVFFRSGPASLKYMNKRKTCIWVMSKSGDSLKAKVHVTPSGLVTPTDQNHVVMACHRKVLTMVSAWSPPCAARIGRSSMVFDRQKVLNMLKIWRPARYSHVAGPRLQYKPNTAHNWTDLLFLTLCCELCKHGYISRYFLFAFVVLGRDSLMEKWIILSCVQLTRMTITFPSH